MLTALQWVCLGLPLLMIGGTLINLVPSEHWFIRGWDFPRVQICLLAGVPAVIYGGFFADYAWYDGLFFAVTAGVMVWQLIHILPYTPLWKKQIVDGRAHRPDATFTLVMSNVQAGNTEYDRWLQVVAAEEPDIILAVEVNDGWQQTLDQLRDRYPFMVARPQDNYFGMTLLSKLELVDPEVRFIVQDDIPSIHTDVKLRTGEVVHMVGVHPRPPEPIRDVNATPRDAELVVIGRTLDDIGPCIIAGDLNDVAWSYTTNLFLRVSGMLDPRVGRGMYNTYNAKNPLFRFPLDHVFHSNEFRLLNLRRLDAVGSDHFPMFIELSYEPQVQDHQPEMDEDVEDEEKAQALIEQEEDEGDRHVRSGKAHPQNLEQEV